MSIADGSGGGSGGGPAVALAERTPPQARGMMAMSTVGLQRRSRAALLALAAIVVVAFVMRVYDLRGNPPGFFCDEASVQYDAYLVLHTGADRWGVHFPIYFRSFGNYESPAF